LGSQNLNDLGVAIASRLLESNLKLYIIHITGGVNEDETIRKYNKFVPEAQHKRVQVLGFTNEFYKYAAASDLIISRAGNTAIAEFAVMGRACIIIPSPFLAGGHQLKNAEELEKTNAAVILPNDVQADELLGVVSELLNNDHRRWELGKALQATAHPDAAQKLAKLILQITAKE
jgi:UDP-N-acetylglucosamine--N-acetylmuramyl-(pentapeptide) pyrophosphoryl-undecaprenol N-acetylglucosamine transferase